VGRLYIFGVLASQLEFGLKVVIAHGIGEGTVVDVSFTSQLISFFARSYCDFVLFSVKDWILISEIRVARWLSRPRRDRCRGEIPEIEICGSGSA
jgi:hypothetical protein